MYITCNMLWTSKPSVPSLQLTPSHSPVLFPPNFMCFCKYPGAHAVLPTCAGVWDPLLEHGNTSKEAMVSTNVSYMLPWNLHRENSLPQFPGIYQVSNKAHKINIKTKCLWLLSYTVGVQCQWPGKCIRWHTCNDSWVPHREHYEIGVSWSFSHVLVRVSISRIQCHGQKQLEGERISSSCT